VEIGTGTSPPVRDASDAAAVAEAARLLRDGGLVAFPTETVYGLGADALAANAVARIFAAKGRPASNPLIVHVADVAAARELAREWPAVAETLAARFWPGPLTLVVPKAGVVPDIVTAGGATVGLRVPSHPVALALLRAAGVPVAAPSANRSEEVSPTTAAHVAESLRGARVDLILDAGPTEIGLESTVVDCTVSPPRLLRPGRVTAAMLRAALGQIAGDRAVEVEEERPPQGPARSPGLRKRHYAPRVPLVVVPPGAAKDALRDGDAFLARKASATPGTVRVLRMPLDAAGYAARLYAALREMDRAAGVTRIVVEEPPQNDAWAAVHDRLRRAGAPAGGDGNDDGRGR
jgi:L-threonylcarbamoyladenylate synthase